MLNAVAYYYRVFVAALSSIAQQNTEANLLNRAAAVGNSTLFSFIQSSMPAVTGANATMAQFMVRGLFHLYLLLYSPHTPLCISETAAGAKTRTRAFPCQWQAALIAFELLL